MLLKSGLKQQVQRIYLRVRAITAHVGIKWLRLLILHLLNVHVHVFLHCKMQNQRIMYSVYAWHHKKGHIHTCKELADCIATSTCWLYMYQFHTKLWNKLQLISMGEGGWFSWPGEFMSWSRWPYLFSSWSRRWPCRFTACSMYSFCGILQSRLLIQIRLA